MVRTCRHPPPCARLIRLEDGPPMYRMLGYADKNNVMSDLCETAAPGFIGPFATYRLPPNQSLPFGPGRFGLSTHPLAYTTHYFVDCGLQCDFHTLQTPYHRLHKAQLPEARPKEILFPEMAIPGSGVQSRLTDGGFLYQRDLPPPKTYTESESQWRIVNISQNRFI